MRYVDTPNIPWRVVTFDPATKQFTNIMLWGRSRADAGSRAQNAIGEERQIVGMPEPVSHTRSVSPSARSGSL